jgi:two-component system, OmpR family, sensor histidine kinase BaeS
MAGSLEKLEKLRKTMVADVAHELRTPLTNLRGYLEGLNDGVIAPTPETFQMLQQETLRLVHLVDDLRQLAKADAARAYLKREELSLAELVGQMLTIYRLRLQDKQIRVNTHFSPAADRVVADPDKLLLAIRNLIDNACQYTPAGGSIDISSQRTDEGVKVLFANSGSTIAEADRPYIFERFYRADRSRSRLAGGAGIGLAIVKELIEAHGGQVGVDSSPSEARIWFVLPG